MRTTAKNLVPPTALGNKEHEKEAILRLPFVFSPEAPKTPPEAPKTPSEVPEVLGEVQKTPLEAQKVLDLVPKTRPETAEELPEAQKTLPEAQKTSLEAPKGLPDAPEELSEAPKTPPEAPEMPEALKMPETAPEALLAASLGGEARETSIELKPTPSQEAAGESVQLNKRIQVLTGYTDAIRSLLQSKSKAPFILAGINIYEQLAQIEDSAARCLEHRSDSVLHQLIEMTRQRHDLKSDYELLARQQELVCGVAEVLDVTTNSQGDCTQTGSEVAQSVQDLMDYYGQLGELYPEDQPVIAHIRARTEEWSKGLFYCYEERGSPRTNNSLEQYNDVLKRQRRRVTGQKNVADYIIRHGPYAIFHDPTDSAEEILARFQNVSIETLKNEQAAFHAATRCPRNVRSFRRDPQAYLKKLETIWLEDTP